MEAVMDTHQGHPGPSGRDERAPLQEGGGADRHRPAGDRTGRASTSSSAWPMPARWPSPESAPADVTGLVSVVTHNATAYLPLSELVDLAAERERIAKELEKAKNGLRIVERQALANEKFVAHAPGSRGQRGAGEGR